MDIRDLSKPVTSKLLNETLAKKFGYSINLEGFSTAQLEDVRNKLRTKISQFEVNESYDGMLENHDYQKTLMFLDVINQKILEREMTGAEKAKEKTLKKKYDPSGMKKSMQKQYGADKGKEVYFATIRKRAMDESVPESWINSAISRMQLGESTRDELKSELKSRYDLNESQASWLLCEGEELKAEIIMASRDAVDQITGWLEDVAAMKAEQFLELLDSIREEYGSDVAQQYQDTVRPTLETIYNTLESGRQGLSKGLMLLSGGEVETMGAMPGGAGEMPTTPTLPSAPPGGSAGELPSVGETPDTSREKRESIDYSRRLSLLLNSKKK